MYSVHIPITRFFEARMYLEHNYYTCPRDYTFIHHNTTVEFILKDSNLFERFGPRWGC